MTTATPGLDLDLEWTLDETINNVKALSETKVKLNSSDELNVREQ